MSKGDRRKKRTDREIRAARARRYELRTKLWEESTLERCRACGRVPVGQQVALRGGRAAAGFAGLETCGSVWACPVCAAKIAATRAEDVSSAIKAAQDRGDSVGLLTLTARHHKRMGLKKFWEQIARAWRWLTGTREWRRIKADWELYGQITCHEVTHGQQNGWHPHRHLVLFLRDDQPRECFEKLEDALWALWVRALEREGLTVTREHGIDLRTTGDEVAEALGAYFAKSLALEAVAGQFKKGRKTSRTPFEVLHEAVTYGDADDLALWAEFERASKGKNQVRFSRGLREELGLGEEQTDQEIAEENVDGEDLLVIDREDWKTVAPVQHELLNATEQFGLAGARAWLRGRGLAWREVHLDEPPGTWLARHRRKAA